jgi:hypothetical protein
MSSAFPQILVMGLFVVGLALFAVWGEHEQAAKEVDSKKSSESL